MNYSVGQLVKYRDRQWIVQPSARGEEDILLLHPLGGSELEQVGIYRPFHKQMNEVKEASFQPPFYHDPCGDLTSAKLLFEANRLSFRQASGPFRTMAKLGFRPRAYQLVPLLLALRQLAEGPASPLRLMVADDVGVGKTIEALLIMTEMLERRIIDNAAVLCPPHLCDQWQQEILNKTGRKAVVVRSSTIKQLEAQLPAGKMVWEHFPLMVVSLDFVKDANRRDQFMTKAPELVIVDEVHTCAKPGGEDDNVQQQRHQLLLELMEKKAESQHLLMLTATPHSGKEEQFRSLLKLLNPDFYKLDLQNKEHQKKLAPHFVQRKRTDLLPWLEHDVDAFPKRKPDTASYSINNQETYRDFYNALYAYTAQVAQQVYKDGQLKNTNRMKFWAALSLMRGALSSPAAAEKMVRSRLENRKQKHTPEAETSATEYSHAISFVRQTDGYDQEEMALIYAEPVTDHEVLALQELAAAAQHIKDSAENIDTYVYRISAKEVPSLLDPKLDKLIQLIGENHSRALKLEKEPLRPIVFCTYIETAKYVGRVLKNAFPESKYRVEVVTSEEPDDERRRRIEELDAEGHCILVATDCLSEGINLQDKFDTVIHYDLPWNPNRLEQREGRVDRFGQKAKTVHVYKIYSEDSLVDKRIVGILYDKIRAISSTTGGGLPFIDLDSNLQDQFLLDFLAHTTLANAADARAQQQLSVFENKVDGALNDMVKAANHIKSVYSHNKNLNPEDLKQEVQDIDQSIGTQAAVHQLVLYGLQYMGFDANDVKQQGKVEAHVRVSLTGNHNPAFNVVAHELSTLKSQYKLKPDTVLCLSFESPTPAGLIYVGRNSALVSAICQGLIKTAINPLEGKLALRTAAVRTAKVSTVTTLVMMRMRNVISQTYRRGRSTAADTHQFVAEEMYMTGWQGSAGTPLQYLTDEAANQLLHGMQPEDTSELLKLLAKQQIEAALAHVHSDGFKQHANTLAEARADVLAQSHDRVGRSQGQKFSRALLPIIPPDVMGVFVLLPQT